MIKIISLLLRGATYWLLWQFLFPVLRLLPTPALIGLRGWADKLWRESLQNVQELQTELRHRRDG